MKQILAMIFLGVSCLGLLVYSFLDAPEAAPPVQTEPSVPVSTAATIPEEVPATQPEEMEASLRIGCRELEQQPEWEKIAQDYASVANVAVEVVTEPDMETALVIHSDASDAILHCEQWRDLYDTAAYAQLVSWDMALRHDGKVCGIPSQTHCIGLICNTQLLAAAGYSLSEIDSFSKLQLVVGQIGAMGMTAFAAPDLQTLTTVAASAPEQSRGFVDLYMSDSLPYGDEGAEAGLAQMQRGEAVFYLGDTAAYESLSELTLGILPVYLGLENEQNQTLCTVGSGFLCVRKDMPEEQIQAAMDFLDYLVLPDAEGAIPLDQLPVLAPFRQTTFTANVLEQQLRDDLAAGKSCLVCTPPDQLPEGAMDALQTYLTDGSDENWEGFQALMGG